MVRVTAGAVRRRPPLARRQSGRSETPRGVTSITVLRSLCDSTQAIERKEKTARTNPRGFLICGVSVPGGERNVEGLALIVGDVPAIADSVLLQRRTGGRGAGCVRRKFRRKTDRAAAVFQRPLAGEGNGLSVRAGGIGGVGAIACEHQLAARIGLVALGGDGVAIGVGHGIVRIGGRRKKRARTGERDDGNAHEKILPRIAAAATDDCACKPVDINPFGAPIHRRLSLSQARQGTNTGVFRRVPCGWHAWPWLFTDWACSRWAASPMPTSPCMES